MEAIRNLCDDGILIHKGSVEYSGDIESTINRYMSQISTNVNKIYSRDGSKPSTPLDILRVELFNENGLSTKFDLSKPIKVRICYKNNGDMNNLYLGLQVRTISGQPIFTSTNIDCFDYTDHGNEKNLTQGEGEALVTIPPFLLNTDHYELHVSSFSPGWGLIDLKTGIYFEVYDNGSFASKPFNSKRQGLILRKIPWIVSNVTRK